MKINSIFTAGLLFFLGAADSMAVKIGEVAPDFTLTSCEGKTVKLSDYKDKIVVLEWFNMGCPFTERHYKKGHMQSLQSKYAEKEVVWLLINSTNPKHGNYRSLEKLVKEVKQHDIKCTALLVDSDGKVGRLYEAKTTPHMFVVDAKGNLAYQGAIDDDGSFLSGNPAKAKNYVCLALDELIAGKPVTKAETRPYGCGVKYSDPPPLRP